MRARQRMEYNKEYIDRPKRLFTSHCNYKRDKNYKKKIFTVVALGNLRLEQLGSIPRTIRTTNNTTFTVEIASRNRACTYTNNHSH